MPNWTWEAQQESSKVRRHRVCFSLVSDCLLRQPASNGSGLAGRYSSALPSRDRVLHPCIDRAPKNVNTNGGFFLPADLIRSIFLRPLAPRALPRFCAVGSEEAHLAVL